MLGADYEAAYNEADDYDRATGDLGRPVPERRLMKREVAAARTSRLEVYAVFAAVAALGFWVGQMLP